MINFNAILMKDGRDNIVYGKSKSLTEEVINLKENGVQKCQSFF